MRLGGDTLRGSNPRSSAARKPCPGMPGTGHWSRSSRRLQFGLQFRLIPASGTCQNGQRNLAGTGACSKHDLALRSPVRKSEDACAACGPSCRGADAIAHRMRADHHSRAARRCAESGTRLVSRRFPHPHTTSGDPEPYPAECPEPARPTIKAAPAAPRARRQRQALPWEARPPHAGPHHRGTQINEAHMLRSPVQHRAISLGFDCPARGHRV
jgi:hypothetical protein